MVQERQFLSVATILAETTKEVFEKLVKTPLTFGEPGFKEGKEIKGDVASILGLTGVRQISKESGGGFHEFKEPFFLSSFLCFPRTLYLLFHVLLHVYQTRNFAR